MQPTRKLVAASSSLPDNHEWAAVIARQEAIVCEALQCEEVIATSVDRDAKVGFNDLIIPVYIDTNALMDLLASSEEGFSFVEKVISYT